MGQLAYNTNGRRRSSISPSSGFVAVNSRQNDQESYAHELSRAAINGASAHCASEATRAELLGKFFTTNERAVPVVEHEQSSRRASVANPRNTSAKSRNIKPATTEPIDFTSIPLNSASPVPIPNTPSSLLPYSKPANERNDDSGPYKAEMVNRMDVLQRGDRIVPPCDRCRRLHMDCLKNLTACMGCTRKHAKCSWKDVNDEELRDNPPILRAERASGDEEAGASGSERETCQNPSNDNNNEQPPRKYPHDERQGVADEELLGEDGTDEDELALPHKFEEGSHHHNKVSFPVKMKRPLLAASPTPKIEPESEPSQQQRDLRGAPSSPSPAHGLAEIANGSMNHNNNHPADAALPLPSEGEKMDRLARLFEEEPEETAHPSREGQTTPSFGLHPPAETNSSAAVGGA